MKRWVTLIIFFTVPFCLSAQYSKYSIGIKRAPVIYGNWNYPTGSINDTITVSEFNWAPVDVGAYFNYTFRKNFSIQAEIKPTVESLAYRDNETEGGWFEFTFIEMPFLFQYKGKTRLRGFAEAGLVLKFLMLGDHHYPRYDTTYLYDTYDARGYFNNVALKGSAGGGIMFDINKHFTLIADTRLSYDFTPIGKKSVVDNAGKEWSFDTIRPLNISMISFGVAYKF